MPALALIALLAKNYLFVDVLCLLSQKEIPILVKLALVFVFISVNPMGKFWNKHYESLTTLKYREEHIKSYCIITLAQLLIYVLAIRPYFIQ